MRTLKNNIDEFDAFWNGGVTSTEVFKSVVDSLKNSDGITALKEYTKLVWILAREKAYEQGLADGKEEEKEFAESVMRAMG